MKSFLKISSVLMGSFFIKDSYQQFSPNMGVSTAW
jgi:hypothetical protein